MLLTIAVTAGLVTPALAVDDGPPSTPDPREAAGENITDERTAPDPTQPGVETARGQFREHSPADDDPSVSDADAETAWGITTATVPDLLRAHCPELRFANGLVVTAIGATSPAAELGVRRFDVLLALNGIPLDGPARLGEPDDVFRMTVLRRGRITPLVVRRGRGWQTPQPRRGAAWPFPPEMPFPPAPRFPVPDPPFGPPHAVNPFPGHAGAVASASSTANGSMSVSRVGDQISIELVSPATEGRRVRLHGTVAEIEKQMETQGLSQAARREVRAALGTP